ncbi:MAG: LysR family transcriptional regulator [Opitutales bacterium]|nr:LysR family transcriptional regulator [Opitutales bacterium]
MNLDLLRTFFAVLEAGSLNKAAERLHVSQSTLTRQIQSLEQLVGGRLLERTSAGVVPTAAGQELREGMQPVVERFDTIFANVRRFAQGQRDRLRVGYVASAAAAFLNRALADLRAAHPEVKVQLLDLSPGEQIAALRKSEVDVALLGHAGVFISREFYTRCLASVEVAVALSECDSLAEKAALKLADLRDRAFVGAPEADMPGHNHWVVQLCRGAGFRPRFALEGDSLAHGLSSVVTESAVMLVPAYLGDLTTPGVVFRPLDEPAARWEIYVAWQRGKLAAPVKTLLDALARTAPGPGSQEPSAPPRRS